MAAEHLEHQRVPGLVDQVRAPKEVSAHLAETGSSTDHPSLLVACVRESSSCGYSRGELWAFRLASFLVIVDINACNHEVRCHRPVAQTAKPRLIASMFLPC